MKMWSLLKYTIPLMLLALLVLSPADATVSPDTQDAILSLLQYIDNLPPSWQSSDIDNVCTWTGVSCNTTSVPYFLLHTINLDAHAATTIVSGALPDVFAKLQDLEVFRVSGTHIGGPLPPSIFTPKLRELGLANNDFESTIPETIGAATSLSVLILSGNHFSGTIPASIKNVPLTELSLQLNNLNCPIPDVVFTMLDGPGKSCSLQANSFGILGRPGICGNYSFDNAGPCKILPMRIYHSVELPALAVRQPDFKWQDNGLELRVYDYSIYVYRLKRDGTPFEDEYLVLDICGLGELPFTASGYPTQTSHIKQTLFYKFDALSKEANQAVYHLKATSRPHPANLDLILDLDPARLGFGTLKFSANITGFQFNGTSSYFSIVFGLTLKGTYSPRVPIECDYVENLAEATVRANCTNIDGPSLIGNSDLNGVIFTSKTAAAEIDFNYPLTGLADGANTFIVPLVYLSHLYGNSTAVPQDLPSTVNTQAQEILIEMAGAAWKNNFYYDPTFNLALLFETDEEPMSDNKLALGLGLGIAAAAVAIAIVFVFLHKPTRTRLMPFKNRKSIELKDRAAMIEAKRASTWVEAMTPRTIMAEQEIQHDSI